jgi:hypothetical protein
MVAVGIRRARLRSTIRVASSSAAAVEQLALRQLRQLLAKQLRGGDDHGT